MNRVVCALLFGAIVVAFWTFISSTAANPTTRPVAPADNSYCFTCHINFQQEKLAFQHQQAGVGCDKCHGPSDKHSSDENGITPPDIMFPKEQITIGCANCHKLDVLEKDRAHEPLLTNKATEPFKYCTDCHGKHVTPVRTRRWDKLTRQLIQDDGVRMVEEKK